MHIGILCAMPEEIGTTIDKLKNISNRKFGDLQIFHGKWHENNFTTTPLNISVAWSGWGKVSAARAATRMISTEYNNEKIDLLIFTGVAGAASSTLKQWDIVLPMELIQHDMDARPLYEKYVIPTFNQAKIKTSAKLIDWAYSILKKSLTESKSFHFGTIEKGLIATGDKFISDKSVLKNLSKELPEILAVEMEGASVAQVAVQENIPFLIMRVISDQADDEAAQNFSEFIDIYKNKSFDLIEILLKNINERILKDILNK